MKLPDFLEHHADGEIRFIGSRIGLEHVVRAFRDGYTAEMIAGLFPTLSLVDIYKAVVFYLENREAVEQIIATTDRDAANNNSQHPSQLDMTEMRRRMAARAEGTRTRSAS